MEERECENGVGRGGAQLLGSGVAGRREEIGRESEKEGQMDKRRQREKES